MLHTYNTIDLARWVGKWEGQQVGGAIFHTSIQKNVKPLGSFEMQHLGFGYQQA